MGNQVLTDITVSLTALVIAAVFLYFLNYLRKCRKISNLTDKLRESYKCEEPNSCIGKWHGLYGGLKILYWRRCSCCFGCSKCCSGCSKCCSNESNTVVGNVSLNSSIAGPSHQRDEDVNEDVQNERDRLMKSPTAGPEHVSIQCDKEPNNLLDKKQFETMCKKYEQYDLYHCNFSQGCTENIFGHVHVIFLLILDWKKVIEYGMCNSTEDWCRHMYNVAVMYGGGSALSTNNSNLKLLDEKKFKIVILKNFPKNWKDSPMELSEGNENLEGFLRQTKLFVESGSYYEYK